MSFVVLTANHHDLEISDVESLAQRGARIKRDILGCEGISGAVVLSTCNRYDVYLEAEEHAARKAMELLGSEVEITAFTGIDAARHVFEVASGLDSMVVGEREIVGQFRRALAEAREEGTTSPLLEQTLQGALRTSREIAAKTDFSRAGRSIVGVALDLAGNVACERGQYRWDDIGGPTVPATDWSGVNVLLVGTGAYAGATVAALEERGAEEVRVWSKSGRGRQFAADHGISFSPELDLAWPDVIVLCRGTGSPVLTVDAVREAKKTRGPLTLVDLARSRDVESAAGDLEDVTLIDLETVRRHVPAAAAGDVESAQRLIAEGLEKLDGDLLGRTMDPLIVAVRNMYATELEKELSRMPAAGDVPAEHAVRALQRLAAAIAYHPTRAAQQAAQSGRGHQFHEAAELVFGMALPEPTDPVLAPPACPRKDNSNG